eukprot:6548444-Pyramimonas_sp.AAC.1
MSVSRATQGSTEACLSDETTDLDAPELESPQSSMHMSRGARLGNRMGSTVGIMHARTKNAATLHPATTPSATKWTSWRSASGKPEDQHRSSNLGRR